MSAGRVRTVVISVVGALLVAFGVLMMLWPSSYVELDAVLAAQPPYTDTGSFRTNELPLVVHTRPPIVEVWRGTGIDRHRLWRQLAWSDVFVLLGAVLIARRRRTSYLALAIVVLVVSLLFANSGGQEVGQVAALVSFVAVVALIVARVVRRRSIPAGPPRREAEATNHPAAKDVHVRDRADLPRHL